MKTQEVKSYTTGQVAKICGLSRKVIIRLFDYGHLNGHQVQSRYKRRTDRRIPVKCLIEFMKEYNIPMENLDKDNDVQKIILDDQIAELKNLTIKAGKRSGVFSGFKGLTNALLNVVDNLDPLDSLSGVSEDRKRAAIFKKLVEVMERHVKLRSSIASYRKK